MALEIRKDIDINYFGIKLKGTKNPKGFFVNINDYDFRLINVKPTFIQKVRLFFEYDFIWLTFRECNIRPEDI